MPFEEAKHHITVHGNGREKLFHEPEVYTCLLYINLKKIEGSARSEPSSFGRDGARPSKMQTFLSLQLFAAILFP